MVVVGQEQAHRTTNSTDPGSRRLGVSAANLNSKKSGPFVLTNELGKAERRLKK